MDADPNTHRPIRSHDLPGGRDRVGGTGKGDEEGVTLGVDLDPVMTVDRASQGSPVVGEEIGVSRPVLMDQPGRALDIGEQEGDGAGREVAHGPIMPSPAGGAREPGRHILAPPRTALPSEPRLPMTSQLAITAEGLVKIYKSRKNEVRALDGLDLEVAEGTVLGLLGPNGAGKTTTVRILATLLKPDAGRATVAGFDVVKQAEQVRFNIGLAGQYASVDELLTGRDNLEMVGRLYHLPAKVARRRGRIVGDLWSHRRRRPNGQSLRRRHAAPARSGGESGRLPAGSLS